MGCCNGKRALWSDGLKSSSAAGQTQQFLSSGRETLMTRTVGFEYVGSTALSLLGPITRTHYRFTHTGAQVEVDHRDAPYLTGVPNLRRVRNATVSLGKPA
jgi:hypothetical protein